MTYAVLGIFVLVVALLMALHAVGNRLVRAWEKERETVFNVSDDVARWWLDLSKEERYDLERRARAAGWGVTEWLSHLHEEADWKVFQAGGHLEAKTLPESKEVIWAMMELIYSSAGSEPPERPFRARAMKRLFS